MSTQGTFIWNELATSDVDGAVKFYTEVVGWQVQEVDMGEGGTYHLLQADGENRCGLMPLSNLPEGTPPHWMGYIAVDDVDATCEAAKANGGRVLNGPFDVPDVGRMAAILDPQGAAICIMKEAST